MIESLFPLALTRRCRCSPVRPFGITVFRSRSVGRMRFLGGSWGVSSRWLSFSSCCCSCFCCCFCCYIASFALTSVVSSSVSLAVNGHHPHHPIPRNSNRMSSLRVDVVVVVGSEVTVDRYGHQCYLLDPVVPSWYQCLIDYHKPVHDMHHGCHCRCCCRCCCCCSCCLRPAPGLCVASSRMMQGHSWWLLLTVRGDTPCRMM